MVVLEAAAITAGGVAAYKGGKAAVSATAKKIKTSTKLKSQEKDRKETYDSRKQERKERFAQINQYRNSVKDVNGKKEGMAMPSFNWKSEKPKSSSAGAASTSRSNASKSSSGSNWWEK